MARISGGSDRARYRSRRWARVRRRVLDRDGWRCRYCGKAGRLEVDHRVPVRDGGGFWDLGNLQALCRSCHFRKTGRENTARRPPRPEVQAWRDMVAELIPANYRIK